jgi:hypothetical protein
MGLEADCEVRHGRRTSRGHAQLESSELHFRGGFTLKIPFRDIRSCEARSGALHVAWPGGNAVFALGAAAEKWALKILYPRGLMDKLGVKADSRVSVLRLDHASILKELRGRTPHLTEGRAAKGSDVVLALMEAKGDLAALSRLRAAIRENGAIWVIWPKGRKELREDDVRAAALAIGLVDVKVASVSDALSGLKLVIPVAHRKAKS